MSRVDRSILSSADLSRFLQRADNLLRALIGLPLALSFTSLVGTWTKDTDVGIAVVAIGTLFIVFGIAIGTFSFGTLYLTRREKAYTLLIIPGLLLVLVCSAVVSSTSVASTSNASQASAGIVLRSVQQPSVVIPFCLFMFSLSLAFALILPDIRSGDNDWWPGAFIKTVKWICIGVFCIMLFFLVAIVWSSPFNGPP